MSSSPMSFFLFFFFFLNIHIHTRAGWLWQHIISAEIPESHPTHLLSFSRNGELWCTEGHRKGQISYFSCLIFRYCWYGCPRGREPAESSRSVLGHSFQSNPGDCPARGDSSCSWQGPVAQSHPAGTPVGGHLCGLQPMWGRCPTSFKWVSDAAVKK